MTTTSTEGVWVYVIRQSSTCRIGNVNGEEVHAPFNSLVPCVHPNDVVIGGWDISKTNLADAMVRAGVLPVELQDKVAPQVRRQATLMTALDEKKQCEPVVQEERHPDCWSMGMVHGHGVDRCAPWCRCPPSTTPTSLPPTR